METKIVCFVNTSYLRIARNWLRSIEKIGISEFATIVTLDLASRQAFTAIKVRTMHRPLPSPRLDDLWLHRTLVIAEILEDGYDVIHSDADAVWIRNPLPVIFDGNEDLVFSQGTIWPAESLEKRGFVLCCGLYAARSNDRVKRFFGELIGRLRCNPDDQRALNLLVDERFPDWEIDRPNKHSFDGKTFISSREKMRSRNHELSLSMLPHHLFPRMVKDRSEMMVGHPLSGKNSTECEEALKKFGLWILD